MAMHIGQYRRETERRCHQPLKALAVTAGPDVVVLPAARANVAIEPRSTGLEQRLSNGDVPSNACDDHSTTDGVITPCTVRPTSWTLCVVPPPQIAHACARIAAHAGGELQLASCGNARQVEPNTAYRRTSARAAPSLLGLMNSWATAEVCHVMHSEQPATATMSGGRQHEKRVRARKTLHGLGCTYEAVSCR